MKSLLKIVAASLSLAGSAGVAIPAVAGTKHVEFRVDNGYYAAPVHASPRVIYDCPVQLYRYRAHAAWREYEWRARQRREYWRERNEWREQQWREHCDHWKHGGDFDHGYYSGQR